VALSVSMTLLSTLWGVVLTPWLLVFYAAESVSIDILAILLTMAKIVILPIVAGIAVSHYLPELRQAVNKHLANAATIAILAIIAIV
ncbi:bile acid:sodium symporter, partial [Wenyingzhuangia sp. 1_MG-2023]|nr:bile acid:sodium symporter [Wenyingzhuangia sp. 1_MG-2023]